jgi:hypothetical protein
VRDSEGFAEAVGSALVVGEQPATVRAAAERSATLTIPLVKVCICSG